MKQLTLVAFSIGLGAVLASTPVLAQQSGTPVAHVHEVGTQGPGPQTATQQTIRWEFRVGSGAVVPTAAQRDVIKRGHFTAAQLHYFVRPDLAVTATVGWARSRDVASFGEPKLDIFTYDVGAEVRPARWTLGKTLTFSPFVGVGAGARSYNYRDIEADATHNIAGYLSAGGEFGLHRFRVRLEVRDYLTGFTPLRGEGSRRERNDVVVIFGIRLVKR